MQWGRISAPQISAALKRWESSKMKTSPLKANFLHSIRNIVFSSFLVVYLAITALGVVNANSENTIANDTTDANEKTFSLIELFTSHGCSSCPPADEYLGELLAEDDQLMALEFHVDYWNSLIHGKSGNFVDPYSNADYSTRQREYYQAELSGRPGVYTPQAVINGRFAAVGSNRRHVRKALGKPAFSALDIDISSAGGSAGLNVQLSGTSERLERLEGADVMLARYLDYAETSITGGENKDRVLVNHHIVTSFERIAQVSASGNIPLTIAAPAENEGCVILVQDQQLRVLHAAAACP